ncbi:hypothetical protein U9M48_040669 [Paspalum notatum var. saurae]|uniref:Uncharacterized protein n=1 Tax=Paspalum notatum var. saurae TaxID=547442 RepID=A0AAQ3XE08_PASNO
MKRKAEEMKATASSLRTQKTDQKTKLKGLEATVADLKKTQKELEAALAGKDNRISQLEEEATNLQKARRDLEATVTEKDRRIKQIEQKATNATKIQKELETVLSEKNSRIRQMEEKATGSNPDQMAALMEILQRKEAELEEFKARFQDFKKTDRADVNSKSFPMQKNNASATPDAVVVIKATNSSSVAIPTNSEEKRPANATATLSAKPEEQRPATTVAESKRPKDRSLEEQPAESTANKEDDGIQDELNDFDEDIDIDDIYAESRSKKSGSPRRSKKLVSNNRGGTGQSENSLDQDSYNRLMEKENTKVAKETKKNSTNGTLEKNSKDSLNDGSHTTPRKAAQGVASATDVKPDTSIPANSDEAKQQNRKQKKKSNKSKKKKVADVVVGTNVGGEVAKQRTTDATSI